MFTGIVEALGTVRQLRPGAAGRPARLVVDAAALVEGTRVGDSVSVNGCCLTVTEVGAEGFAADVMGETLDRTGLGELSEGARVNLERALRADARLGGHLVQGHVDAVTTVTGVDPQDGWTVMTFALPAGLAAYLVEKGSITVDGTSLTVMAVAGEAFSVGLIPHTTAVTVLGGRVVGDRVNLEVDVIAKYVERLIAAGAVSPYVPTSEERP